MTCFLNNYVFGAVNPAGVAQLHSELAAARREIANLQKMMMDRGASLAVVSQRNWKLEEDMKKLQAETKTALEDGANEVMIARHHYSRTHYPDYFRPLCFISHRCTIVGLNRWIGRSLWLFDMG